MPRGGPPTYTYSLPPIYLAVPGTLITAAQHNTPLEDIATTLNTAWPVNLGGTGGTSAAALLAAQNQFTATQSWAKGADIASSATLPLGTDGNYFHVTGTTGITAISTKTAGTVIMLEFDGALTITNNASTLILPNGGGNITTAAGDTAVLVSEGPSSWRMIEYQRANGSALAGANNNQSFIVNGSMMMSQENGNTLGTTNGYFAADQWALYFVASTAAMSIQRVQVRTLANAVNQLEYKCTTAKASLGASDNVLITQPIEGSWFQQAGFGTANAVPLVLRFQVTLPAGIYHWHFANSAANRHCSVPFTVAAGEANTAVVKQIIVPRDTSGTWLTADGVIGVTCDLVLAAGSAVTGGTASTWGATTYYAASTQFNILSSTSNVARIGDVGLKLDPDATGVYGQYEVAEVDAVYRSERYWETSYSRGTSVGTATFVGAFFLQQNSGTRPLVSASFAVEKCKGSGTITIYNPQTGASGSLYNIDTAASYATTFDYAASTKGFEVRPSTGAGGAAAFHWTANARLS